MTAVRLLSYNIRSMRDDTEALARVIGRCRPDVVCVQEAPRFWRWRGSRRLLAHSCDLRVAAGKRTAGLAIFTGPAAGVLHHEYHLLSWVPGLHRRALAIAVLEIGTARLIVADTHLDLLATARHRHATEALELIDAARRRFGAPVVLAGDVNEEPGGPTWELLAATFADAYATAPAGERATFSARDPRLRIDGVFVGGDIRVISCGVPGDAALAADYPAASDHRPVLAELEL